VYIGGSAEIQPGATLIGPVVIGAGAVIEAGAHIEQSVVTEHTRVGGGTYCRGKIVGSNYCASADGTVLDGSHTDTAWMFGDARSDEEVLNRTQEEILGYALLRAA
jgi:mannose-1-phosphate guanylyltransferase